MRRIVIFSFFILIANTATAQRAFIKLQEPARESNTVNTSRHYITGTTCKGCTLTINGNEVKVYSTGAFAIEINLVPGDTTFLLSAFAGSGKAELKNIFYKYILPSPPLPDSTFSIESITTYPVGNLQLSEGDKIAIKIKALRGCKASWLDDEPLFELPVNETNGMPGIYQGYYIVKKNDPLIHGNILITLTNSSGQQTSKLTPYQFFMMPDKMVGQTIGSIPYLEYGLGNDRLGGAKMGYLDTLVKLRITGKVNDEYKVKLSPELFAYIPEDNVQLLPQGTLPPSSLTHNWRVWGDSVYDYVSINLSERLPYRSQQLLNPSRIAIDIFGATSNTNWITQYQSVREIKDVNYEQLPGNIVRVIITLNHQQPWGYHIYYEGNDLIIKVKQQPAQLTLDHLTVAVDAGHGGYNSGAHGITGVYEKTLTLLVAKALQQQLQNAGAHVIMTRTTDASVSMEERTLFLRKQAPDLMISIHLNASADPIHIEGTSAYYRYIGFRPLSLAIYKRMTALGLGEFGNVGGFNFALNGPTEYPNALVETLFLSNPADEEKVLDPTFREKIAGAILQGIKDFLKSCAE